MAKAAQPEMTCKPDAGAAGRLPCGARSLTKHLPHSRTRDDHTAIDSDSSPNRSRPDPLTCGSSFGRMRHPECQSLTADGERFA